MGFFSKIAAPLAGAAGTFFGGPVGGALASGAASSLLGGGRSGQTTTKKQMWKPQRRMLKGLFEDAQGFYDQGPTPYFPGDTNAPMNPYLTAGLEGMGQGFAQPYLQGSQQALSGLQGAPGAAMNAYQNIGIGDVGNIGSSNVTAGQVSRDALNAPLANGVNMDTVNQAINNPVLQGQIDAASRDVTRNLQDSLKNTRYGAALTGNAGSTSRTLAEGLQTRAAGDRIGDIASAFRGAAYGQGYGTAADQARGNQMAQMQAGLANQSTGLQAGLANQGADLRAGLANQGVGMQAGLANQQTQLANQRNQLAAQLGAAGGFSGLTGQYGNFLGQGAQLAGQNLAGQVSAGERLTGDAQQRLDEQVARHYYPRESQRAEMDWLGNTANRVPASGTSTSSVGGPSALGRFGAGAINTLGQHSLANPGWMQSLFGNQQSQQFPTFGSGGAPTQGAISSFFQPNSPYF